MARQSNYERLLLSRNWQRTKLSWDYAEYTPQALQGRDLQEIRAEYNRLRSVANKRLEKLANSEWSDTELYDEFALGFKAPSKMEGGERELRTALEEVARFIQNPHSTITGNEQIAYRYVNTMNERGYDFVTRENYRDVVAFFEDWRQGKLDVIYDSDAVAQVYELAKEKKVKNSEDVKRNFEWWLEHREEIENYEPPAGRRTTSSAAIKRQLKKKGFL